MILEKTNNYFKYKINTQQLNYSFFWIIVIVFGSLAFLFNSPEEILMGQISILLSPSNLVTDYFAISNVGATLFNSALLTAHSIAIIKISKAQINGAVIAGVLTVAAFSFFGKNLYNSTPIVIGAFAYAWVTRMPAEKSLLAALFGTALGPLVSEISFNLGLPLAQGILYGYAAGFFAGFFIPPIANHVVDFTKGFSVYNVGFTCGIIGTLFISVIRSTGKEVEPVSILSSGNNEYFTLIFLFLYTVMLGAGLYLNSWSFKGYKDLLKHTGQLSTDFLKTNGFQVTLINMSLLGFLSLGYVHLHGGELNGPVIGGILTVVGFGAFGKHIRNVIPILLGVSLMGVVNDYDMSDTGVVTAGLFGTTIAPIAGRYGKWAGMLAGALHLSLVSNTDNLHGGINLYNNGFSGGFVAAIMIPLLEAFHYHKEKRKKLREPVDPAKEVKSNE
ncbi:DUF1576 domain-containing protein [Alkalibacterium kapii]|uniref:Membrane protein n=1 Tax=Alkalibacterium kapii TaxID=426704 RepID=A0A511AVZ3_9LACT|nr:DUF1576 domain-containing protein [Alkalibacterium kapii]GEK91503.1 membrane protein [Alkalibacterium kapii]